MSVMIGVQRRHDMSMDLAASRRRHGLLRRMSSCPEEAIDDVMENLRYSAYRTLTTTPCLSKCGRLHENRAACFMSLEQGTEDLNHDPQSRKDSDKDEADGPINVIRRQSQRKLGCLPRESIGQRIFQEDKSFDLNPKHHPLLRSHSLSSLDNPDMDAPSSPNFVSKVKHWFKDHFGGESTDTDATDPVPIHIHHSRLTGRENFGCSLRSFRSQPSYRWFHLLHHVTPRPEDSLANQLKLRKNDEILMINREVVTLCGPQQVLEKFKRCLENDELTLVIRRLAEDNQYEFIEIKAQIELTDTMIRVSLTYQSVRNAQAGRYHLLNVDKTRSLHILIGHNVISCENGRLVVRKNDGHTPYAFSVTTVYAWQKGVGPVPMYVLQETNTNNFVEVTDSGIELRDVGGKWRPGSLPIPTQPDPRFFCVEYRNSEKFTFLQSATKHGYYLACKESTLKLKKADDPVPLRDVTGFEITTH